MPRYTTSPMGSQSKPKSLRSAVTFEALQGCANHLNRFPALRFRSVGASASLTQDYSIRTRFARVSRFGFHSKRWGRKRCCIWSCSFNHGHPGDPGRNWHEPHGSGGRASTLPHPPGELHAPKWCLQALSWTSYGARKRDFHRSLSHTTTLFAPLEPNNFSRH